MSNQDVIPGACAPNPSPSSVSFPSRRRALTLAGAALALPALAAVPVGAACPDQDQTIVAAFQDWLDLATALGDPDLEAFEDQFEDLCERQRQAMSEIMAIRPSGSVGLALQVYVALSMQSHLTSEDHEAALTLPNEEEHGELTARVLGGLFDNLCAIAPDLRSIATAKRGAVVSLSPARLGARS